MRGDVGGHHVDGRTDAVAAEMVLGEPDGVVAGLVHDVYSFHCAAIDRLDWEASFGPAKELQYAKFHNVFPLRSTCRRPLPPECSDLL